jgi:hypothetical protein
VQLVAAVATPPDVAAARVATGASLPDATAARRRLRGAHRLFCRSPSGEHFHARPRHLSLCRLHGSR